MVVEGFALSENRRGPGRPPKFESVQQLEKRIAAYFRECDPHVITRKEIVYPLVKVGKKFERDYSQKPTIVKRKVMSEQVPYTITGLALYLGTTRDVLIDYQDKEEYSNTIKEAKLRCEEFAERRLFEGKATGPIFNLKNNYGWRDTRQLEGNIGIRRSEYEDLTDEQLKSKIDEALDNLRNDGDGTKG